MTTPWGIQVLMHLEGSSSSCASSRNIRACNTSHWSHRGARSDLLITLIDSCVLAYLMFQSGKRQVLFFSFKDFFIFSATGARWSTGRAFMISGDFRSSAEEFSPSELRWSRTPEEPSIYDIRTHPLNKLLDFWMEFACWCDRSNNIQ